MAEWENSSVSPLKVTSGTTVIQHRILCSTHRHIWEIHRSRIPKAGIPEWAREAGMGERQRQGPQKESGTCHGHSWYSHGGGVRLHPRGWEGQKQHSGLSSQCPLWLTPVMEWKHSTAVWQPQPSGHHYPPGGKATNSETCLPSLTHHSRTSRGRIQ